MCERDVLVRALSRQDRPHCVCELYSVGDNGIDF